MANNIDLNQLLEELNEVKNKLAIYKELKGTNIIRKPSNKYTDFRSKNFKDWFFGSLVIDKNGEPLVVFHGTNVDITKFRTEGMGKTEGTGAFFSSSPVVAGSYGDKIYAVYLSLQNPLIVDACGANWNNISYGEVMESVAYLGIDPDATIPIDQADEELGQITTEISEEWPASTDDLACVARERGYDGAIFTNVKDKGPAGGPNTPTDIFVAFYPDQIKTVNEVINGD